MELAEGEILAQQIERGPLPLDEALEICRQIAQGLEAAHDIWNKSMRPNLQPMQLATGRAGIFLCRQN
jgi:serine/threonine protein kinase